MTWRLRTLTLRLSGQKEITLGHKDISTTLNIYTDVTKELRRSEFEGLDSYFKNEYNKAANI